jgi:hypothetical protein
MILGVRANNQPSNTPPLASKASVFQGLSIPYPSNTFRSASPGQVSLTFQHQFTAQSEDLIQGFQSSPWGRPEASSQLGSMETLRGYAPFLLSLQFQKLPPRQQKTFLNTLAPLTLKHVAQFDEKKLFGLLEESSDILFELNTYLAIQQGVLHPQAIQQLMSELNRLSQAHKPFPVLFASVASSLTPEQILKFQRLIGLPIPKNAHANQNKRSLTNDSFTTLSLEKSSNFIKAKELLTLIHIKFILFTHHKLLKDIEADTLPRIGKETEEFIERLPSSWLSCGPLVAGALRLQSKWIETFPNSLRWIPSGVLQWLPQQSVKLFLRTPNKPQQQDLVDFQITKHLLRNELDYSTLHQGLTYQDRKKILKPFELLLEATALQKISQA